MSAILKTIAGAALAPLVRGLTGRIVRHSITPAAAVAAFGGASTTAVTDVVSSVGEGFIAAGLAALQEQGPALGATLGAFVVSLILSRISDAVQEIKDRGAGPR